MENQKIILCGLRGLCVLLSRYCSDEDTLLPGGFMRRTTSCAVALVALLLLPGSFVVASGDQSGRGSTATVPDLPYKLVEWPTPPATAAGAPGAWNFIQVASVAISPRGTILVLHRGAHPIMEFESSGKFVRSWGDGMISEGKVAAIPRSNWAPDRSRYAAVYGPAGCDSCGAHSVRVDRQGNIWVVDAAGHVIYKMN